MEQLVGEKISLKIKDILGDRRCICLIVEENKLVVGFGCITIYQTPEHGILARIEDVVVDKDFRGNGFGKMLIEHLIKEAQKRKISKVFLTSNPNRIVARKMYKQMGFKKVITDTFILDVE
jgi:phosphinothricin acetyltransferase